MKNRRGDQLLVENRRFDQTMIIGRTTVPDYNNVAFFPPAGPHGSITQGIFVWRLDVYGDRLDPGYSNEGLIYASGRYGRTYPENDPSDTDDGVPFPGASNKRILSPWSDPRSPYQKEADFFKPGVYHYNLFVPNTKGGFTCGMEILSEDRQQGTFRVRFYTSNPPNPGLAHQPDVDSIGAYEGRRTICRGDSGVLHQVFVLGGEIFYRQSTDGGSRWQKKSVLSTGNGGNSAPCVTMAGSTVLVVWQVTASGIDRYVLHSTRSTDNGNSWASLSSPGYPFGCSAPGPYPLIAGSNDGSAILVYRADGPSLVSSLSHDAGISWSSPRPAPLDSMTWNSTSLLMSNSLTGGTAANIAYCTDSLLGPRQVQYNRFSFAASAWGSPGNISGILPARYAGARYPNLAFASQGDSEAL
ncbi:MAG: hypothetical protein KAJ12_06185, partial [Bacteroidetes bacterium]|nr:hypothetical protein [Bacteroidota bacterium]